MSASIITQTEGEFLKYLGQSLKPHCRVCEIPDISDKELARIYELADRHEVSALLENVLGSDNLTEKQRLNVTHKTARTVHKAISLQALNASLTAYLEKQGITAVTLKGFAVAQYYPVPEFRKTADIDLFVFSGEDAENAKRALCEKGFETSKGWHPEHHIIMFSPKREIIELHTQWAESFKEKHLNKYLQELQRQSVDHCRSIDCNGCQLYVYETAYQGFYLLVHMLQHFVASGFGIRNLCDWVVFWENCDDKEARKDFLKMVNDSGTAEFAKAVSCVCVKYLGFDCKKSPVDIAEFDKNNTVDLFLRDILDAGEFGKSESERMVGMDGSSINAYLKEFHHQMHINFPKAGNVILLWPVLWLATLIRFLNNNKKLHRAPALSIIKKAGRRGKLVRQLVSPNNKKGS